MELTHINEQGRARMVDVTEKAETVRTAVAEGRVHMSPATVERIRAVQKAVGNPLPIITVCGVASAENAAEAVCQAGTDGVMLASAVIRKILAGDPLEQIGAYLGGMLHAMEKG